MVAMPQRQYSAVIIGPSWPLTEPSVWYDATNALNNKAVELNQAGADVFKTACFSSC
jgi:hypothetical protein